MNPEILLFLIKLITGGIVAFLAILIMSKTRDAAWMSLVGGFILSSAALIYELLIQLGVLTHTKFLVAGIPLTSLLCAVIPSIFFITAFILMLLKK